MTFIFFKYIKRLSFLFAALIVASCSELADPDLTHSGSSGGRGQYPDRQVSPESRKVLIMYSAGYNSLTSFLKSDISDLKTGWLPGKHRSDDVLLVYSHFTEKGYATPTSPVLTRVYEAMDGSVVTDTLLVYEKGTISSSASQLSEVLTFVRDEFPARSYGMIFSSHATGYLPAGYYTNSSEYEKAGIVSWPLYSPMGSGPVPVPYVAPCYDPSLPMTKSIGQDQVYVGNDSFSYEMDLVDFADAIPMYMDYILFDACLMGGVEVAYQLKDVCRRVGFSQAEVLAEGFDYTTLTTHLLMPRDPDPQAVCEDYFAQYADRQGLQQSATISLVDCTALETLADVCSRIFSEYSSQLSGLNRSLVQRYYRYNYHWFYDMESIIVQSGVTGELLEEFYEALGGCIVYKAATPSFMDSFDITTASGLSMFLPSDGGSYLKRYYKGLAWNQTTGLVQ